MVAQHEDVPPFEIAETDGPDGVRVTVRGELDMANAFELTRAIVAAGMRAPGEAVQVDLSGIVYMDSTGVRALLDAGAASREDVVLVRPSQAVLRVLDIVGLTDRFRIED